MGEELLAAFSSALSQSDVERALSVCEEFELLQVPPTRFPDRSANVGLILPDWKGFEIKEPALNFAKAQMLCYLILDDVYAPAARLYRRAHAGEMARLQGKR
jgi:hypothetical protein